MALTVGEWTIEMDYTPGCATVNRVLAGHTTPVPVKCEAPAPAYGPEPAYRWDHIENGTGWGLFGLDGALVATMVWSDEAQSEVAQIVGKTGPVPCTYHQGLRSIARHFGVLTPSEQLVSR